MSDGLNALSVANAMHEHESILKIVAIYRSGLFCKTRLRLAPLKDTAQSHILPAAGDGSKLSRSRKRLSEELCYMHWSNSTGHTLHLLLCFHNYDVASRRCSLSLGLFHCLLVSWSRLQQTWQFQELPYHLHNRLRRVGRAVVLGNSVGLALGGCLTLQQHCIKKPSLLAVIIYADAPASMCTEWEARCMGSMRGAWVAWYIEG